MLLFIGQGRFRDPTFLGLTDRSIWSSYIQEQSGMQWLKGKGCPDSSESSIAIPSMSVAVLFCCSVVAALATALAAKSIFTRWGECFEMQPWQRGGSHGDVVQQAYFCLGYRELEPRLKRSNRACHFAGPWLSRCTEQYLLEAAAGLCTVDAEQNGPGVVHHPALAVVGGGATPPGAPGLRTRRLQSVLHAGAVARVVNSALRSLTLCLRMHSVLLVR